LHTVGKRIKDIRARQGLNQKDFCKIINLSQGRLSEIEQGKNYPSFETLRSIKENFDVSLDWLITGRLSSSKLATVTIGLSRREMRIISYFQRCDEDLKQSLLVLMNQTVNRQISTTIDSHELSQDEHELIALFRQLQLRDRIKIEGILDFNISSEPPQVPTALSDANGKIQSQDKT